MLIHEFFKKLNGAGKDLNVRIDKQNIRGRAPDEGFVCRSRKATIVTGGDQLGMGAKSGTESNEPSFRPLSITMNLTTVVCAITDSIERFSNLPGIQMNIGTGVRI